MRAGMCWVKRGAKDCFELETDDDLNKAKSEYTIKASSQVKDLRLACHIVGQASKIKYQPGIEKKATAAKKLRLSEPETDSDKNTFELTEEVDVLF